MVANTPFDVAVVGLGAAGSSALAALARAGVKAVGIDRYAPPHGLGSTHGETRLLRTAYSEGAAYVPMVLRSIGLWRELERLTGTALFRQTGVFYCGPRDDAFLASAKDAARQWDLPLAEGRMAGHQLALPADWQTFEERDGGYLFCEPAIDALLQDAKAHGATILTDCRCAGIDGSEATLVLQTSAGAIRAGRVVVTTGAWIGELIPELAAATHVERRVLHWYRDLDGRYRIETGFKPFVVTTADRMFYGFPANAAGEVKVAEHFSGARIAGPEAVDREISIADSEPVDGFVAQFLPGLGARTRGTVCLYPMSWDEHFILDRSPRDARITIGAGLSGHGFKFAPVIGEALANMALEQPQEIDVDFFALARRGQPL
jgi:monomeric sarcosine oxidase